MSVVLARQGATLVLTVDQPQVHNALDFETIAAFEATVARVAATLADGEDRPRVLVVTGGGGRFISGGNLRLLAHHPSVADGERLAEGMQRTLSALAALPIPVLAAVDGAAVGGGGEVLLACDLVVLGPDARIAFRQVHMGVTTAWGGARRLVDRVGRARALRLLWTGETIAAAEALALGLVDRVAPAGSTGLAAALALAAELAAHPPEVLAGFKRLVDDPHASETAIFAASWAAEPHQRAVHHWLTTRGLVGPEGVEKNP